MGVPDTRRGRGPGGRLAPGGRGGGRATASAWWLGLDFGNSYRGTGVLCLVQCRRQVVERREAAYEGRSFGGSPGSCRGRSGSECVRRRGRLVAGEPPAPDLGDRHRDGAS